MNALTLGLHNAPRLNGSGSNASWKVSNQKQINGQAIFQMQHNPTDNARPNHEEAPA